MNITVSGIPVLALQAGAIVLFSLPIWLAARVVGADYPTFLRAVVSLVVCLIGAFVGVAAAGSFALVVVPVVLLLSFKYVLGTSFVGAVVLAALAAAGYAILWRAFPPSMQISALGVGV